MERFDGQRHLSFAAALARLPGPGGERFGEVFRHGSLLVELYAPLGHDPQGPHDRDEIYVVVRGGGVFVVGGERRPFEAGDVLFAPAGTTHRFEDFRFLLRPARRGNAQEVRVTRDGYTIRKATVEDLAHVLHHRRRMFEDMGYRDEPALDRMSASSAVLLRAGLSDGTYHGWVVERAGAVVAGGGVISLEFQPHPRVPGSRRSWIVNVYTEPTHRRKGLARWITETIVAWCRETGLPAVFLHASDEGRGLYESLGFQPTSEMVLALGGPDPSKK